MLQIGFAIFSSLKLLSTKNDLFVLFMAAHAWCMVPGAWCMVATWLLLLGIIKLWLHVGNMLHGCMLHGAWCNWLDSRANTNNNN